MRVTSEGVRLRPRGRRGSVRPRRQARTQLPSGAWARSLPPQSGSGRGGRASLDGCCCRRSDHISRSAYWSPVDRLRAGHPPPYFAGASIGCALSPALRRLAQRQRPCLCRRCSRRASPRRGSIGVTRPCLVRLLCHPASVVACDRIDEPTRRRMPKTKRSSARGTLAFRARSA